MIVTLSNRHIGGIKFDAVTSEDHSSELSITENPIESGAMIADHAVLEPKQITINGVMVDHSNANALEDLGVPYIRETLDFMDSIPVPVKIVNHTAQTIAKANRVIGQVKGVIDSVDNMLNKARGLAPWLPDFGLGNLLGNPEETSRVKKCYMDLLACQKSGETIEIQTGIALYKNMLIQSISVTQSQDGSAVFMITAREIFIVETQQIAAQQKTTPMGKRKSGRAEAQSSEKVQMGETQPKEKDISFMRKGANNVGSAIKNIAGLS